MDVLQSLLFRFYPLSCLQMNFTVIQDLRWTVKNMQLLKNRANELVHTSLSNSISADHESVTISFYILINAIR